jgi:hypothetical protein
MGYYFRLPSRGEKLIATSGGRPVDEKHDRVCFVAEVDRLLKAHGCPPNLTFKKTVQGLLNEFYNSTSIPGILLCFSNIFVY